MEPMQADYFESYQDLEVHKLMLSDQARNEAYRRAIFENKDQLIGKTVLDIGAGTGILSIFCAQAGAAKVFAVEASQVYKIAEEIVKENKFENIIKVIHGRIEDIELSEKVDIIVSEWMGFYLLHEGMLDSVIIARDKYLKDGGLMFPESASLFAAPCSVPSMYDYWTNVSGVSMSMFGELLRTDASQKPIAIQIRPEDILTEAEIITWLDLREVTIEDLNAIKMQHVAVVNNNHKSDAEAAVSTRKFQGICLWFTCTFPATTNEPVILSTEPEEPLTHWKQTVIVLPNEREVEPAAPIAYQIQLTRNKDEQRRYQIELEMLDPEVVEHPEYCKCHMTKCILVRAMLEKYEKESLPQ